MGRDGEAVTAFLWLFYMLLLTASRAKRVSLYTAASFLWYLKTSIHIFAYKIPTFLFFELLDVLNGGAMIDKRWNVCGVIF
jgi:hypothetical protein